MIVRAGRRQASTTGPWLNTVSAIEATVLSIDVRGLSEHVLVAEEPHGGLDGCRGLVSGSQRGRCLGGVS